MSSPCSQINATRMGMSGVLQVINMIWEIDDECQNCGKYFDYRICDKDGTTLKGIVVFICPHCRHGNY
jgi:hypothetical protein